MDGVRSAPDPAAVVEQRAALDEALAALTKCYVNMPENVELAEQRPTVRVGGASDKPHVRSEVMGSMTLVA